MAKLIAGILILLSSILLGGGLSATYNRRVKFLNDYLEFITFAEGEIGFYKSEMKATLEKFTDGRKSEFCEYVRRIHIDGGKEERLSGDGMLVKEFIDGMAELDINSQKGFAALCRDKAEKALKEAEDNAKSKGSLTKRLAPLVGAALFLILI